MGNQQRHGPRLTMPWFNHVFGVRDGCPCMYDISFKAYTLYQNGRFAVFLTDAVELCELADYLQVPERHGSV